MENTTTTSSSDDVISQLETDLLAQPNNYALHVKLIKTLTDKEKLESARETFAERFPLTPELWTEWIEDEVDLKKKEKLYERALEDYLDVSVYAAYLQHVLKTVKDHDRVREIYDLSSKEVSVCSNIVQ